MPLRVSVWAFVFVCLCVCVSMGASQAMQRGVRHLCVCVRACKHVCKHVCLCVCACAPSCPPSWWCSFLLLGMLVPTRWGCCSPPPPGWSRPRLATLAGKSSLSHVNMVAWGGCGCLNEWLCVCALLGHGAPTGNYVRRRESVPLNWKGPTPVWRRRRICTRVSINETN